MPMIMMQHYSEIAAAVVYMVVLLVVPYTTAELTFPKKTLILLAGQSNMVGKGGVNSSGAWDGIVPKESEPNLRIFRLNNNSDWEVAREPLHAGIALGPYGVGPGLSFANTILQPWETIGLIPCAREQTSIKQWQRGSELYNLTLARAGDALSDGGGVIRAMLWYQGEADTNEEAAADAYENLLVQFFTDLRADLSSPYLPIIQVALAKGSGPYRGRVRGVQLNTKLPGVFCVDADELDVKLQDDGLKIHLDTPSEMELGEALAAVFLNNNI